MDGNQSSEQQKAIVDQWKVIADVYDAEIHFLQGMVNVKQNEAEI